MFPPLHLFCHKYDGFIVISSSGFISFTFHFVLKFYNCPRFRCYLSNNLPINYVAHCSFSEEYLLYWSGEL